MDRTFGTDNFRSEIIWQYRRWSNSQRDFLPAHQTIYFYSKSSDYIFNPIYLDYSPSTNIDQILQRRRRDVHGKSVYDRDGAGRVVSSGSKKGVPLGDVWDIPYLNPKAKERVGYPTQKPIVLLDRIIRLASNPGDLVLDPFCGSGTTLVAATIIRRRAIGFDISEDAVSLARNRLLDPIMTRSSILDSGRESVKTIQKEILDCLAGIDCIPVHRNRGMDAILVEQYLGQPVPVRVQRRHESVGEAAAMLHKAGRSKNAEIMILIVTSGQRPGRLDLPPGVSAVESMSLRIAQAIGKSGRGLARPLPCPPGRHGPAFAPGAEASPPAAAPPCSSAPETARRISAAVSSLP